MQTTVAQDIGAGGHGGVILRFRDVGGRACTVHGYPGLDALRSDGTVLVHATRTLDGYLGGSERGVPTVRLRPGGVASAIAEFTHIDANHPRGNCPYAARIAVTAPNLTRTVRFHRSVTICNLDVHPTVPGADGVDPPR